MARAPKKKQVETTKYTVTQTFHGYINDTHYDHKKGDIVEFTPYEVEIYGRFIKEIK